MSPLLIVGCRGRDPLVEHGTQCGLRLRQAHARTQAGHHLDPIIVRIEILLGEVAGAALGSQQEIGVQRNIEIRRHRGIDAEESRRRDPGCGLWNSQEKITQWDLRKGSRKAEGPLRLAYVARVMQQAADIGSEFQTVFAPNPGEIVDIGKRVDSLGDERATT